MDSTDKFMFGLMIGALLFLGTLVVCSTFESLYKLTLKQECILAAVEQNYTAIEIQGICDRKQ